MKDVRVFLSNWTTEFHRQGAVSTVNFNDIPFSRVGAGDFDLGDFLRGIVCHNYIPCICTPLWQGEWAREFPQVRTSSFSWGFSDTVPQVKKKGPGTRAFLRESSA
jgi:hypothetical protein